jgi:pyrimidine operon attenuation protein/uracil phosphoribosyltransferase
MKEKKQWFDAGHMEQKLERMTKEIAGSGAYLGDMILVGIRTRGFPLAERIGAHLEAVTGSEVPVGVLDITLYRDDITTINELRAVKPTELPEPIDNKIIILVDDVFYTGRTMRAAMDALIDFGRPRKIMAAVLVNRLQASYPEVPIFMRFIGESIPTVPAERINVRLKETDGEDAVWLMEE